MNNRNKNTKDLYRGVAFAEKACRGEESVFLRSTFHQIDISQYCKEQDYEIYAIQLVTRTSHLFIFIFYLYSVNPYRD
jgi:hypothetical protein